MSNNWGVWLVQLCCEFQFFSGSLEFVFILQKSKFTTDQL